MKLDLVLYLQSSWDRLIPSTCCQWQPERPKEQPWKPPGLCIAMGSSGAVLTSCSGVCSISQRLEAVWVNEVKQLQHWEVFLLSCLLWACWMLIASIPLDAVSKEPGCLLQKLQSALPFVCSFIVVRSWEICTASDPDCGLPKGLGRKGSTPTYGHLEGKSHALSCPITVYFITYRKDPVQWLTFPIHFSSLYSFTFRVFTFKCVFLKKLYRKATLDPVRGKKNQV